MHIDHTPSSSPRAHRILRFALVAFGMTAIFVADTTTNYEVVVAMFYTVVILIASRVLRQRGLIALAAVCIAMTVVSFAFTVHGDFQAGLINMGISIAATVMITFVILRAEAARTAAHDAQAQLMRMARVKSLEGLTTSIAHEINQPLAAIVTSGHACQRWLAQDPPNLDKAHQALDRILSDAGRASTIIARVRSLTKGEPPRKSEFDFNKAIMEIVALSQAEMGRNRIVLATNLTPDLPAALADRVQMQQVVGNLVLNAIEAIAADQMKERVIRLTSKMDDDCIVFTVFDSGDGIPASVYEHLFEAFWTTKEEGIGVGLSISRAIVEANGGKIWAEPNAGGGAVFRFCVPTILQKRPQ